MRPPPDLERTATVQITEGMRRHLTDAQLMRLALSAALREREAEDTNRDDENED